MPCPSACHRAPLARTRDEQGNRRLNDKDEWVGIDLAAALQRGDTLVPILVGNAAFPKAAELPDGIKELVDYNGLFVRHELFDSDINKLIRHIKALDLPFRWAASHHDRYDTVGIVEPGQFVVVLAQPILRGTEVAAKGPRHPKARVISKLGNGRGRRRRRCLIYSGRLAGIGKIRDSLQCSDQVIHHVVGPLLGRLQLCNRPADSVRHSWKKA